MLLVQSLKRFSRIPFVHLSVLSLATFVCCDWCKVSLDECICGKFSLFLFLHFTIVVVWAWKRNCSIFKTSFFSLLKVRYVPKKLVPFYILFDNRECVFCDSYIFNKKKVLEFWWINFRWDLLSLAQSLKILILLTPKTVFLKNPWKLICIL